MIDCTDIKALLSAIVDDQLDRQTRHEVERHLGGCEPCRTLLSQAEALDRMIRSEADEALAGSVISPEFEGAVLAQTVYARPIARIGPRWVSYTGWFAAAASIALAGAIWYIERGSTNPIEPAPRVVLNNPAVDVVPASLRQSFVTTEMQPREVFIRDHSGAASLASAINSGGLAGEPVPALSVADADTLYSTSLLLDLIAQADTTSFADIEQVRRRAEYDDLLTRLNDLAQRNPQLQHSGVSDAESILFRAVRGPVSTQDVQEMRQWIAKVDLAARLERLSRSSSTSVSL